MFDLADQLTCLDRLRQECIDIRSRVDDHSTEADLTRPGDDAHGSAASDAGSEDDVDDVTARSSDSSSHCLVNVRRPSASAAEAVDGQQGLSLSLNIILYTVSRGDKFVVS